MMELRFFFAFFFVRKKIGVPLSVCLHLASNFFSSL